MKQVFINYKKARSNMFIRTIYNIVSDRLNRGTIFEKIKFHFFHFLKFHDFLSIKKCFFTILIYCFGGRLIHKILGFNINKENELIISQLSLDKINKTFYHWAPKEKINIISKEGLLPKKNHNYVYMTDNSDFIKNQGYLFSKTLKSFKRDSVFVLFEINTSKLAEKYKIYKTFKKHEFVVEKVPLDCLLNLHFCKNSY